MLFLSVKFLWKTLNLHEITIIKAKAPFKEFLSWFGFIFGGCFMFYTEFYCPPSVTVMWAADRGQLIMQIKGKVSKTWLLSLVLCSILNVHTFLVVGNKLQP